MYKPGYATVGNFLEPRITSEDEVKIRVHYCAINSDDYSMYMGKLKSRYASYGLLNEFSGVITQVGSASESAGFSVGDPVSGTMFSPCGMCPMCRSNRQDLCVELNGDACLNEFIVINNRKVVRLPQQLPLRQGALFLACGLLYALRGADASADWADSTDPWCRQQRADAAAVDPQAAAAAGGGQRSAAGQAGTCSADGGGMWSSTPIRTN